MTQGSTVKNPDAQPGLDRRDGSRTSTVFRPVLIETEDFAGFCLVRNLSPNGMMGQVYTRLADGTGVMVQFHPELTVAGSIVWSREGQVGVEFDTMIDVQAILKLVANRAAGDWPAPSGCSTG